MNVIQHQHTIDIGTIEPKINDQLKRTSSAQNNKIILSTATSSCDLHVLIKKCLKKTEPTLPMPIVDANGKPATINKRDQRVSFRDEVQHVPIMDVLEVEAFKKRQKLKACESCSIV